MTGLELTRRGWVFIVIAAALFGIATAEWTYYDYQEYSTQQEETP